MYVLKNEETWNTNKFSDVAQFPMGPSPDMRVWERRLLYCVPVSTVNSFKKKTLILNLCMQLCIIFL